jgi:hypothetical protein
MKCLRFGNFCLAHSNWSKAGVVKLRVASLFQNNTYTLHICQSTKSGILHIVVGPSQKLSSFTFSLKSKSRCD